MNFKLYLLHLVIEQLRSRKTMKMAIIGSGPLAIFCAQYFDSIGAEVVLFQRNALGGNVRFLLEYFPQMKIDFQNQKLSLTQVWEEAIIPSIKEIEAKQLTKAAEVLRVQKRFLQIEETIPNHSRLHDLFRVIYSVNPKEAILKQLEDNPELFNQLGEQVISSLHTPVESFEDFDIVIDARGLGSEALPMGPSQSWALNELNIKSIASIFYEKTILTNFSFKEKTQILVVGNSDSAAMALLYCRDWLFEKQENRLTWVTPTSAEQKWTNDWLNQEVNKLMDFSREQYEKEKVIFEDQIHEWRDLEDYVKVKVPKPIEPEMKLKIFQGYNVTSVDRLLDRDGLYATLESPDFRKFALSNDLKTLATDAILVGFGLETKDSFARGIRQDEPGYYHLDANNLDEGLKMIKKIEEKILTFFSRAQ